MDNLYQLINFVTIFFLLVVFIQVLKRQVVFTSDHQPVFNRIITELLFPVRLPPFLQTGTGATAVWHPGSS